MSLKTSEASIRLFISILLPISSKLVVSTFLAACPNSSNSRSASLSFASICIASVDVAPNSDCVASNCRLRISIVFSAFSDCWETNSWAFANFSDSEADWPAVACHFLYSDSIREALAWTFFCSLSNCCIVDSYVCISPFAWASALLVLSISFDKRCCAVCWLISSLSSFWTSVEFSP